MAPRKRDSGEDEPYKTTNDTERKTCCVFSTKSEACKKQQGVYWRLKKRKQTQNKPKKRREILHAARVTAAGDLWGCSSERREFGEKMDKSAEYHKFIPVLSVVLVLPELGGHGNAGAAPEELTGILQQLEFPNSCGCFWISGKGWSDLGLCKVSQIHKKNIWTSSKLTNASQNKEGNYSHASKTNISDSCSLVLKLIQIYSLSSHSGVVFSLDPSIL